MSSRPSANRVEVFFTADSSSGHATIPTEPNIPKHNSPPPSTSQSNKELQQKCSISERGGVGSAVVQFAQRSEYACKPPHTLPPSYGSPRTGSTTPSSRSTSSGASASGS